MNLGELINLTTLKLGEQSTFYPPAEVVRAGLNPAQRLLCLVYPMLLRSRTTATIVTDVPFLDLRLLTDTSGNPMLGRVRKLNRVVLGNVSADAPVRSSATGELRELRRTTMRALRFRPDWLAKKGPVREYWLHGPWLGLYKRPVADTTITLMFDAIPKPLVLEESGQIPDIQDVYHAVMAEIAVGLLLVKEGLPDGARGLQRITQALQLQTQGQVA